MGEKQGIPVWVLNLKRDEDRLLFMHKQLEELGVEFRVIEGVDGRFLAEKDLKYYSRELAISDFGRELTPGEIGCALSHARMWELLIKEHQEEVLILEDDVSVGRSLFNILDNRSKLPEGYEHINFSTSVAQIPFGEFIIDIYRASRHKARAYSAGAYLLTSKGARKLLKLVYPIYMPSDYVINTTDLISYGIYPTVVVHADNKSSIGKRGSFPKPGIMLRKYREFKEIVKAIAIFLGFTPQLLIKIHLQINHAIGRLLRR